MADETIKKDRHSRYPEEGIPSHEDMKKIIEEGHAAKKNEQNRKIMETYEKYRVCLRDGKGMDFLLFIKDCVEQGAEDRLANFIDILERLVSGADVREILSSLQDKNERYRWSLVLTMLEWTPRGKELALEFFSDSKDMQDLVNKEYPDNVNSSGGMTP